MKTYLVLGSDTGVGKTTVTAALLRALRQGGAKVAGFKPFATGDRGDALALAAAAGMDDASPDDVNPCFYQAPMAPYTASVIEERPPDWDAIDRALARLGSGVDCLLIEGAGGVMTPITREETMLDLALRWGCPALLVVQNRLGSLSQALCAAGCLRAAGVKLAGLVLNSIGEVDPFLAQSNFAVLEERFPGLVFSGDPEPLARLAAKLLREE